MVQIVADAPDEPDCVPELALDQPLVTYLDPIDRAQRSRLLRRFLLRRPLALLNLFVYVVLHRYHANKSPYADTDLIRKAAVLAGVLEQRGVTHVHAPWADAHAFLAMIAARLLRIPYSIHVRAHEIHSESSNYALKEKLACASFAVTNSSYNEAHLRPLLAQGPPERLQVIYNGVDLRQFVPASQRNAGPAAFAILAVGRLVEQKGFEFLLRACRKLSDRGLGLNCEIIGGPQPSEINTYVHLKKLHRRLNLEQHVHFLGAQPFQRVLEAYTRVDLFVLPCVIASDSSRDVTPNALIEAMAMQLPVVSTPIGAVPEIVDDGVDGILVSPQDEDALADAIEVLVHDPGLRRRLGLAARKKIESRFDINKNVQRYTALYRNAGQPR
jgi:glycosyltransferase involved in cell wall biosynthesis